MKFSTAVLALACVLGLCEARPHAKADTDVSSEIAKTMAAIVGRAQRSTEPRQQKLGLSKMKSTIQHRVVAKQEVDLFKKAEAPKDLAGYLGWAGEAKKQPVAFSTNWKNSGDKAAESLYMNDLAVGHHAAPATQAAHKQALVVDEAITTPFSKMMKAQEASFNEDQFAAVTWGKAKPKMALAASSTKTNHYLDAVGWTAPEVVKAEDNYYMRTLEEDPSKKKFLAAMAVTAKPEAASKNSYLDDLTDSLNVA